MAKFVYAPISGEVKDIVECSDTVFSEKMLGDGVIIIPSEEVLYSPFDGKIESITDSMHAITLKSDDGLDFLIHTGIDTVELRGKGFKTFVKNGQLIKKGDKILSFDRKLIKENGYEDTVILVSLTKNTRINQKRINQNVHFGDPILMF
ncbi:PTS glucose transporter subunit IIA [Streptococcus gallolyticus]|uniref:PTS sugar transporter subunit IIA n=1 Tax=Streptococcus gallolyticus TaxID=315405 RepID=UPI0022B60DA7|nr:PTS glucose transporter subunit IIA [Streptococcus gallolyticus]WAW97710.1 PTS glucose transporter subunit IIA [Streptococcus gallolyticus]